MTLGLLDRPEVPPPLEIQHPEGFTPPKPDPEAQEAERQKEKKGWFSWLPFVS